LTETDTLSTGLESDGFAVVADVIDAVRCDILVAHLRALGKMDVGSRLLLMQPWCRALAGNLKEHPSLNGVLVSTMVAVQCTLFDKSPTKNWLVSLHQDLSVPVKQRIEHPDCAGWSEKEGQVYVQPPVNLLEQLVAVRVHADECPTESGALRVIPGSHTFGRLERGKADELRRGRGEIEVPVPRGGALVMRPLILHASSKTTDPKPRRVLHFVFGPPRLPLGLEWQWAI
jgi:Phytanoyl-CoA dioxygenase (PhyH)